MQGTEPALEKAHCALSSPGESSFFAATLTLIDLLVEGVHKLHLLLAVEAAQERHTADTRGNTRHRSRDISF